MKEIALVFMGGGLGSIARWLVAKAYNFWQPSFPYATLTSNFLSCLVFGLIVMLGISRAGLNDSAKLFLITGFCGGFSTYSSFTFETVELFKNGQSGLAFCNIVLNFFLSVCGLYLGTMLARLF